ncbi:MAG: transglycosylase domain-containing protein [Myxococcota bacterium]
MLRFLSDRRAAIAAVSVGVVLAIAWAWAVRQAPSALASRLEARLGLEAQVGAADLGLRHSALREVVLTDESGGLTIKIERAEASVSPLRALWSGAAAVDSIEADGIDVSVNLDRPGVDESIAALMKSIRPSSRSAGTRDVGSGTGRTYVLRNAVVDVRDADGPLLRLSDLDLRKEGDVVEGSVAQSLIGDADRDHARVGRVTGKLSRSEGRWRLASFGMERGSVRWLDREEGQGDPLAIRLRRAASSVLGERSTSAPATVDEAGGDDEPGRRAFLSRLSSDALISVSNVDVESRTPSGQVERIEGLDLSVKGVEAGWFAVKTSGRTSTGGKVEVDLKLQPVEARAEGSVMIRDVSLALVAPFVPEVPFYEPETGSVTAELDLDADATGEIRLDGVVSLRDASLFSERLAPEPIQALSVEVRGRGVWLPVDRRLTVDEAQVRMNEARVLLTGELERTSEHYRVDVTARLPPTPCNRVVGAIPGDVMGSLRGFAWAGTWGGIAHLAVDSRDLESTELSIRVRNLCEFVRAPRWVRIERFQEPFRHTVVEPDETTFQMVTGPETDNWVPLAEVSPFMVEAVLSHEDARFYDHGGFAPWAIRDALVRNLEEGRYVVGASTISMQLAKNLYLKREKTIARKVQEVILTWWLESMLTKDEMLELYLNVIEYGPATYGLLNASAYYFGRLPRDLSPAEAAFLACILPSPKRYHTSYERDALTRGMRGKMTRLLEHMAKRERIGPEALAYGIAEIDQFDFQQEGDPAPVARVLPPLGVEVETFEEPDPFEALFVAP